MTLKRSSWCAAGMLKQRAGSSAATQCPSPSHQLAAPPRPAPPLYPPLRSASATWVKVLNSSPFSSSRYASTSTSGDWGAREWGLEGVRAG